MKRNEDEPDTGGEEDTAEEADDTEFEREGTTAREGGPAEEEDIKGFTPPATVSLVTDTAAAREGGSKEPAAGCGELDSAAAAPLIIGDAALAVAAA
jgi:hypothetical protein